jgi:hypothetical protein
MAWRGLAIPTMVFTIGVGLATLPRGLGPGLAVAASPSGAELDEAIRFRAEMGLGTDRAAVEELIALGSVSPLFDVALTSDEETLLLARGRIQSELDLGAFRAAHRSVLGGLWLSYPPGGTPDHALTVNVALTGNDSIVADQLASLLPDGADLAMHEVRFTEADLDALHPLIAGDQHFFRSIGSKFYAAFTDVRENVVVIVVPPFDAKTEAAILDRFGEGLVRVVSGGPVQPDVCTRSNCGPPWRGGLKIARSGGQCTSNFIVKKWVSPNWTYALWTAGHCGNAQWRMGTTSGPIIGTTAANHFGDLSDADVQVIPISAVQADDDYITGTPGCGGVPGNPCGMWDVTAKHGTAGDMVGEMIRNSGAFSGTKNGTVASTNFTFTWEEEGVTLLRQRLGTYTRMSGDSGGPVTALTSGGYTVATGLHSHFEDIGSTQYAVYSNVGETEQISGWVVYTDGD